MLKKMLCYALCASVLATGVPVSVSAAFGEADKVVGIMAGAEEEKKEGLVEEDGCYCYYEDGKLVKNSWRTIDGTKYYFKKDGKAATLNYRIKGKYYIFNDKGQLVQPSSKEIVKIRTEEGEVKKFYVNPNGTAASGWAENKTYYFYETGEMATGIIVIKENFYAFNASGKCNKAKTKKLKAAAKYEQPVAALKKLLGKPQKTKYYASCYGDGKDGVWTYAAFKVYTFKPKKGAEIYMGVE